MSKRYLHTKVFKGDKGSVQYGTTIYPSLPPEPGDVYVITQPGDRLDLLANDHYGDSSLWWVISRANPDITKRDSFFIKTGVQIRIPPLEDIPLYLQEYEKLNAVR